MADTTVQTCWRYSACDGIGVAGGLTSGGRSDKEEGSTSGNESGEEGEDEGHLQLRLPGQDRLSTWDGK